ncbi:hypothetical protein HK098_002279 [Nowakowskiella sp. JEL0407]|nr:hypothetical protein HK098_002279 [Nowakowskiella sp. JEL0407]
MDCMFEISSILQLGHVINEELLRCNRISFNRFVSFPLPILLGNLSCAANNSGTFKFDILFHDSTSETTIPCVFTQDFSFLEYCAFVNSQNYVSDSSIALLEYNLVNTFKNLSNHDSKSDLEFSYYMEVISFELLPKSHPLLRLPEFHFTCDGYDPFKSIKINRTHASNYIIPNSQMLLDETETSNDKLISITGTAIAKTTLATTATDNYFIIEISIDQRERKLIFDEVEIRTFVVFKERFVSNKSIQTDSTTFSSHILPFYYSIHIGKQYKFQNLKPKILVAKSSTTAYDRSALLFDLNAYSNQANNDSPIIEEMSRNRIPDPGIVDPSSQRQLKTSTPRLISYSGTITSIPNPLYLQNQTSSVAYPFLLSTAYILDGKYYLIFSSATRPSILCRGLRPGARITVSNTHLITVNGSLHEVDDSGSAIITTELRKALLIACDYSSVSIHTFSETDSALIIPTLRHFTKDKSLPSLLKEMHLKLLVDQLKSNFYKDGVEFERKAEAIAQKIWDLVSDSSGSTAVESSDNRSQQQSVNYFSLALEHNMRCVYNELSESSVHKDLFNIYPILCVKDLIGNRTNGDGVSNIYTSSVFSTDAYFASNPMFIIGKISINPTSGMFELSDSTFSIPFNVIGTNPGKAIFASNFSNHYCLAKRFSMVTDVLCDAEGKTLAEYPIVLLEDYSLIKSSPESNGYDQSFCVDVCNGSENRKPCVSVSMLIVDVLPVTFIAEEEHPTRLILCKLNDYDNSETFLYFRTALSISKTWNFQIGKFYHFSCVEYLDISTSEIIQKGSIIKVCDGCEISCVENPGVEIDDDVGDDDLMEIDFKSQAGSEKDDDDDTDKEMTQREETIGVDIVSVGKFISIFASIVSGDFEMMEAESKDYMIVGRVASKEFEALDPRVKDESTKRIFSGKQWLYLTDAKELVGQPDDVNTPLNSSVKNLRVEVECEMNVWNFGCAIGSFVLISRVRFVNGLQLKPSVNVMRAKCSGGSITALGLQIPQSISDSMQRSEARDNFEFENLVKISISTDYLMETETKPEKTQRLLNVEESVIQSNLIIEIIHIRDSLLSRIHQNKKKYELDNNIVPRAQKAFLQSSPPSTQYRGIRLPHLQKQTAETPELEKLTREREILQSKMFEIKCEPVEIFKLRLQGECANCRRSISGPALPQFVQNAVETEYSCPNETCDSQQVFIRSDLELRMNDGTGYCFVTMSGMELLETLFKLTAKEVERIEAVVKQGVYLYEKEFGGRKEVAIDTRFHDMSGDDTGSDSDENSDTNQLPERNHQKRGSDKRSQLHIDLDALFLRKLTRSDKISVVRRMKIIGGMSFRKTDSRGGTASVKRWKGKVDVMEAKPLRIDCVAIESCDVELELANIIATFINV